MFSRTEAKQHDKRDAFGAQTLALESSACQARSDRGSKGENRGGRMQR